jgi:hypothetical protein
MNYDILSPSGMINYVCFIQNESERGNRYSAGCFCSGIITSPDYRATTISHVNIPPETKI